MSHRSTGVYRILERPAVYQRFQAMLGGPHALRRFVDEFVRPQDGAALLDAGCGTGALLDYLPESVRYAGFDFNPAYIETARSRYGPRGTFLCARVGQELPDLRESSFDLVVAVALLHHLSDDDAGHLMRTAARLLAPGGTFVTIDGTLHPGQGLVSRTLARLDRGRAVRTPEAYRRLLEPHFANIERWLVTDMLAVPYSHCILRGAAPR
jgi:SAM-dependent methyltransferase